MVLGRRGALSTLLPHGGATQLSLSLTGVCLLWHLLRLLGSLHSLPWPRLLFLDGTPKGTTIYTARPSRETASDETYSMMGYDINMKKLNSSERI
jgi:hypothetical protein